MSLSFTLHHPRLLKTVLLLLLLPALIIGTTACDDSNPVDEANDDDENQPVVEVEIVEAGSSVGGTSAWGLNQVFSSPDGSPLSFEVESASSDIATAIIDEETLIVEAQNEGTTLITVSATNDAGTTTQEFEFTVYPPPSVSSVTIEDAEGEEESFDLNAFFVQGENPDTDEEGFQLVLTDQDDIEDFGPLASTGGFFFRLGEQPTTTTYDLADIRADFFDDTEGDFLNTDELGFIFWTNADPLPPERTFASNSGEVTFNASNEDQVGGTFTMTATQTTFDEAGDVESQEEVTIEGNFSAPRVDLPDNS